MAKNIDDQYFYVGYAADVEDTNESDCGKDTFTEWNVNRLMMTIPKRGDFKTVLAKVPVEAGKVYFVVYVVYSTSDSFRHDDQGSMEIIDVYDNPQLARETTDTIQKYEDDFQKWDDERRYSRMTPHAKNKVQPAPAPELVYKLANGIEYHAKCPAWRGCMEHFDYVQVDAMILHP